MSATKVQNKINPAHFFRLGVGVQSTPNPLPPNASIPPEELPLPGVPPTLSNNLLPAGVKFPRPATPGVYENLGVCPGGKIPNPFFSTPPFRFADFSVAIFSTIFSCNFSLLPAS